MVDKKPEQKKTDAELRAELELLMAKAAIKNAISSFDKEENQKPVEELQEFWKSLDTEGWKSHLELLTKELKSYKHVTVKKILFDLDHYIKDCRKLVPGFSRSKEEILLMVAIGQIKVSDFKENLGNLPNNREKLDRKIHKQIKEIDWQDDLSLIRLDELTKKLDQPKIKKSEIENIEAEIAKIENDISSRKAKRDELAIKLGEWKARGNIDIADDSGNFRLDA